MIISLLAPRANGNTRLGEFHLPGTDASLTADPNLPHDSLGPELIIVSSVLTVLSILAVGARLYTRAVLLGWVGVDDYFILLAEVSCM